MTRELEHVCKWRNNELINIVLKWIISQFENNSRAKDNLVKIL